MIRTLLGKKIPATRWAMTIGLGSSLLAMGSAYAQSNNPNSADNTRQPEATDRVIVTGSNIPSSEEVGAAPVDTIDQGVRDTTGQEDVESVLTRANPAISSGGGNLGASNASISSGSTLGGSTVSIHGLPTLILLDGRRLTDSAAVAAGGSQFADVNLFPSSLVKRIEVLKDGASAIYGTEAVGGVVNVILDQEFQGFEFSARYGFTEKSDVQNQRYSGIFGFGDDKTHIVVAAEYVEQDPLFDRDRNFSAVAFGTTNFAGVVRSGTNIYQLNPAADTTANLANPGVATTAPLTNGTYVQSTPGAVNNSFNLANGESLTLDQTRLNFFGSADRQLIGNHVVAFGEVLYAQNYSQSYLNAQPLNGAEGVVVPATAPYNPFGQTLDINSLEGGNGLEVANRFVSNPRVFRQDTNFWRVVAGLKGEIIPNYNYEVAMNSSSDQITFKNFNLINGAQLNEAIAGGFDAAGNPVTGGAYSMVNGNLQPALNFFSRNPNPASLVGVFGTDNRDFETKFEGLDGKITAFPFNLPAGPVGFAAGGEYRHEFLKANIDPQNFLGSVPTGDIDVGRDVTAGFGELQIPLVSPDMKVPFIYSADLDGAVRYEAYDPGDSTWVPKVGFVLRPIKDIAIRGSFSKSFIAPNLFETNGPNTSGFTNSVTLTPPTGSEQAQVLSGANPNLDNTIADNYTAGIVISPRQIQGLTLNADFFHVEEKRIVGTINTTTILESVNTQGLASPFAGLVRFGGFGGREVTGPNQLAGQLDNVFVTDTEQNLGGARIGGIDFGAHYNHDFGTFGSLSLGIDGTYYLQYKEQTFASTPYFDAIGFYQGLADDVQQYHLTPQIAYSIHGFTASAIGNYTPSLRDAHEVSIDPSPLVGGVNTSKPGSILAQTGQDYLPKIRDYYTIDLLFSYEFHYTPPAPPMAPAPKDGKDGKGGGDSKGMVGAKPEHMMATDSPLRFLDGLKLSFGIENVTNARPSLIEDSPDSSNTDASIYDPYQRQYYFVITKKF